MKKYKLKTEAKIKLKRFWDSEEGQALSFILIITTLAFIITIIGLAGTFIFPDNIKSDNISFVSEVLINGCFFSMVIGAIILLIYPLIPLLKLIVKTIINPKKVFHSLFEEDS